MCVCVSLSCGADKHVDPANDLSLCVRVMTTKDIKGNKGEATNITKMTIHCHVYKPGVKFVVVVFVSSAR